MNSGVNVDESARVQSATARHRHGHGAPRRRQASAAAVRIPVCRAAQRAVQAPPGLQGSRGRHPAPGDARSSRPARHGHRCEAGPGRAEAQPGCLLLGVGRAGPHRTRPRWCAQGWRPRQVSATASQAACRGGKVVPPHPFFKPAFESAGSRALQVFNERLTRAIAKYSQKTK